MSPAEAEMNFLENAKKLSMYGVDLHHAKYEQFESTIGFKLPNHRASKRLWKVCIEHHTFFRLVSPEPPPKGFLVIGSKFRYSGRTQAQTRQASALIDRPAPQFERSASRRYLLSRSLEGASALGDTMDRLSQHTSSDPAHSLSRDDLDQNFIGICQEQDLDQLRKQIIDKKPERDTTSSKTMGEETGSPLDPKAESDQDLAPRPKQEQYLDKPEDVLQKHQASINELKRALRKPNSKLVHREKRLSVTSSGSTPEKKTKEPWERHLGSVSEDDPDPENLYLKETHLGIERKCSSITVSSTSSLEAEVDFTVLMDLQTGMEEFSRGMLVLGEKDLSPDLSDRPSHPAFMLGSEPIIISQEKPAELSRSVEEQKSSKEQKSVEQRKAEPFVPKKAPRSVKAAQALKKESAELVRIHTVRQDGLEATFQPHSSDIIESQALRKTDVKIETQPNGSEVTTTIMEIADQTVKGGYSETRIEKRIIITGDDDVDQDKALAMAIKEAQQQHPDMLVTKAIVVRETESSTQDAHEQFKILGYVAKGSFGPILKVKDKSKEKTYAVIPKSEILRLGVLDQSKEEVIVQRQVRHPFVHTLQDCWQTQHHLYIMCDYCSTGDLYTYWMMIGHFGEDVLKVFAAELGSALGFLHDFGIIHRDVKMENVLLSDQAPEVLSGGPYSHPADWWSLGILLFALATGKFPVPPESDHCCMLRKVRCFPYEMPRSFSPPFALLLTELLCKTPTRRLRTLERFKRQTFFRGTPFDSQLLQKCPMELILDLKERPDRPAKACRGLALELFSEFDFDCDFL
ncbi:Band 4.1-like protein 1 [Bagarius yarrelli]|uniref:Band 4.1-like protein 1 n=1 Tax=Bagarius yarrelli TaxID=175774 RepID=A0A556UYJ5_BAGYA|nr:Band 4.1-like protein 1 [Bagarius yarrelli]